MFIKNTLRLGLFLGILGTGWLVFDRGKESFKELVPVVKQELDRTVGVFEKESAAKRLDEKKRKNANLVKVYLDSGMVDHATKLYNAFNEKEELATEDVVFFDTKFEKIKNDRKLEELKKNKLVQLEAFITKNDIKNAELLLDTLKANNWYSTNTLSFMQNNLSDARLANIYMLYQNNELKKALKQIDDMEEKGYYDSNSLKNWRTKIYDASEEGIYAKIKEKDIGWRRDLANRYLDHYPKGTHRNEIVNMLIEDHIALLLSNFKENLKLEVIEEKLTKIDSVLNTYKDDNISLEGTVDTFKEVSWKYIDKAFSNDDIKLKDNVRTKVNKIYTYEIGWSRIEMNVKAGSIGDIFGIVEVNDTGTMMTYYFVDTPEEDIRNIWYDAWNKDDPGLVAYRRDEIEIPNRADPAKKDGFVSAINKLEKKLERFYKNGN